MDFAKRQYRRISLRRLDYHACPRQAIQKVAWQAHGLPSKAILNHRGQISRPVRHKEDVVSSDNRN